MSQFQPLVPETSPGPVQHLPTSGHAQAPPTFIKPAYPPMAPVTQNGYAPPTVSHNGFPPHPVSQPAYAPPMSSQGTVAPPTSGQAYYAPPQTQPGPAPQDRRTAMPVDEFADKLRTANERQQTNVQVLLIMLFNRMYCDYYIKSCV